MWLPGRVDNGARRPTFLMEAGKDIYTIRNWMGHRALVTTGRYMHVRAEHLRTVKSPLDTLYDQV